MAIRSYGINDAPVSDASDPLWLRAALESLERVGFAVLENQLSASLLDSLRSGLDAVLQAQTARFGGLAALEAIGEANQARALCNEDARFWDLVTLPDVNTVIERLLGPAAIVMQQNGVVMPAGGDEHQQQRWHRDLPYQNWVSSAPLAIGALCALDPFSAMSGGTAFLPGSHRFASFPSEAFIGQRQQVIEAPAGSVILFDAMSFHRGGTNRGTTPRRAVNTLFGVPLLAQQVLITAPPGATELVVRRAGAAYHPVATPDEYRQKRAARQTKDAHDR